MKINFGSTSLEKAVNDVISRNPTIVTYMKNARQDGDWDLKSKNQEGSLLFGKYASPRDAGNFLAGMFANSKGSFMEYIILFGYGAYNLSGNSLLKTAKILCSYIGICAGTSEGIPIKHAMQLHNQIYNGEDVLSQKCINLGINYNNGQKW